MASTPFQSASGVKVTTPKASADHEPLALAKVFWTPAVDGSRSTVETVIVPSPSVSLVVTFTVPGLSSSALSASLLATGTSLISLSEMVMVAPSLSVSIEISEFPVTLDKVAITVSSVSTITSSLTSTSMVTEVEPAGIVTVPAKAA